MPVCITVTLLEGLVLARSIFNHSMNYRSVVVLGKATLVDDPEEKLEALRILSEHILPGRWEDSRQPNERELKATSVLRVPIEEFSAKVRQGPADRRRRRLRVPHMGRSRPAGNGRRRADRRREIAAGKRSSRVCEALHPQTLKPHMWGKPPSAVHSLTSHCHPEAHVLCEPKSTALSGVEGIYALLGTIHSVGECIGPSRSLRMTS